VIVAAQSAQKARSFRSVISAVNLDVTLEIPTKARRVNTGVGQCGECTGEHRRDELLATEQECGGDFDRRSLDHSERCAYECAWSGRNIGDRMLDRGTGAKGIEKL
jgi:hypothetical protein